MTGKELIEFIQENHAEDLLVCVQYRDGGGFYSGADDATPLMGHVTKQVDANNYDDYDITYDTQDVNAIIL